MADLERYRQAIQTRVCSHCADRDARGYCSLTADHECGILHHLEAIVDVVHSTHSLKLEDYIRILRERVCAHCENEKPDGSCKLRTEVECEIDRFFEIVVEAIEEVDEKA